MSTYCDYDGVNKMLFYSGKKKKIKLFYSLGWKNPPVYKGWIITCLTFQGE